MKLTKFKELKNGGADLTIEVTTKEKTEIKNSYNRKRFTSKLMKKFIIEAIMFQTKKENL